MKLIPWLVILSVCLVGCSGSKTAKPVSQETPQIELSDADEFIENPNEEPVAAAEEPMIATEEPVVTDTEITDMDASVMDNVAGGTEQTYHVKKNETLMMIAFKIYGDYGKWKTLANYNKDKLKGGSLVSNGMMLKYMAPAEQFVWNPQGLPYLIRTGDTLGTVSKTVYQTPKKWKLIWDNNRPLIKDANKIFAGFTLYYLESGRDVATEI